MLLSTRSSARALFLFALIAAPAAAHGSVVLASNTSSTGASLRPITEAEVELYYQSGSAAVVTGMRFWFATGQVGAKATFRDGGGNNAGIRTGTFVRTDGAYDVYEFSFVGTSLSTQSQYYAGYAFTNGAGTTVSIGATTSATVSFDSSVFTSAGYGYVVPDPFPPTGTGQFPRFELVGTIPAPGAFALLLAGLGSHAPGGRRRRDARA